MTWDIIFTLIKFFIKEAEDIFGPGTGPDKKAIVIETIKQAAALMKEKLNITVPAWLLTDAVLSFVIDIVVWFYNKVKTFVHAKPNP
jgi:hypothetical protein